MWQSYILTSTALVRHSNWANEWLCCVSPVSNQLWHAIGGTDPWPSQHVADTHIKYYPKIAIPAFGSSSTFHFWLKHIFWKIDIFQQVYRPETSATVDKTLSQWNGGLIYSCAFYHTVQSSCTDTTFGQAGVLVHICCLIMLSYYMFVCISFFIPAVLLCQDLTNSAENRLVAALGLSPRSPGRVSSGWNWWGF